MNIYISNLSYAVNDGDLKDLFGEYGEISSAKVKPVDHVALVS